MAPVSLFQHYSKNQGTYEWKMFVIGFSCHVNTSIGLGFVTFLAKYHGMIVQWQMFYTMLRALFFCSRALNAYAGLLIPHKTRLYYLPIFWYTSYPLMILSYFLMD